MMIMIMIMRTMIILMTLMMMTLMMMTMMMMTLIMMALIMILKTFRLGESGSCEEQVEPSAAQGEAVQVIVIIIIIIIIIIIVDIIIMICLLSKYLPDLEGFPAAPNKSGTGLFCARCKVFDDEYECDEYHDHIRAFTMMTMMIMMIIVVVHLQ